MTQYLLKRKDRNGNSREDELIQADDVMEYQDTTEFFNRATGKLVVLNRDIESYEVVR